MGMSKGGHALSPGDEVIQDTTGARGEITHQSFRYGGPHGIPGIYRVKWEGMRGSTEERFYWREEVEPHIGGIISKIEPGRFITPVFNTQPEAEWD